jgi:hypothetical protein
MLFTSGSFNAIVVHPTASLQLSRILSLDFDNFFFWRQSTSDGLYSQSGMFFANRTDITGTLCWDDSGSEYRMANRSTHYCAGFSGILRSGIVPSGNSTTRKRRELFFCHSQLQVLTGRHPRSQRIDGFDGNCKSLATGFIASKSDDRSALPILCLCCAPFLMFTPPFSARPQSSLPHRSFLLSLRAAFSHLTGNPENPRPFLALTRWCRMDCEWPFPCILHQQMWRSPMTLKIKRIREEHGTRICLSGELRCACLLELRAEIEQFGQPAILDLDEVDVIDIDGIRFLNECQALGVQVVNCSPYIREWMRQEKRIHRDEK